MLCITESVGKFLPLTIFFLFKIYAYWFYITFWWMFHVYLDLWLLHRQGHPWWYSCALTGFNHRVDWCCTAFLLIKSIWLSINRSHWKRCWSWNYSYMFFLEYKLNYSQTYFFRISFTRFLQKKKAFTFHKRRNSAGWTWNWSYLVF